MILVTGAGGFIGSHVVEELVRSGRSVRALVSYDSAGSHGWLDDLPREQLAGVEVVAGDVRDARCVREALAGCEAVLHLAALVAIPYSYRAPASYVETNVGGTLNVLEAAREQEGVQVVHTSTSEVYGTARFTPITEEHPIGAQSPYAASKVGADQLALAFHRSFGTRVTVVRPFNTFGPRQSRRAVIPAAIAQLLAGERRIRMGALAPTRDFTFVSDSAKGLCAALGCEAAIGEVVQLGTGTELSIGEVIEELARIVGTSVEVEVDPTRLRPEASEVERLRSDPRKAEALLGWKPAFTGRDGLRRGLEETVRWFGSRAHTQGEPGSFQL